MTLMEWIDANWRAPNETTTSALERLSGAWNITYKTLFYASKGSRMAATTAKMVEQKTRGLVKASTLVLNPTRAELAELGGEQHQPTMITSDAAGRGQ